MKIIHVSSGIIRIPPDRQGGVEGHIFTMSKYLSKMGHKVTILDRKYSISDPYLEEVEGVHIFRLRATFTELLIRLSKLNKLMCRPCLTLSKVFFGIKTAHYLNKVSDEPVINVYDIYITSIFTFLLKPNLRKKVFFTLASHTFYRRSYLGFKNLGNLLYSLVAFWGKLILKRIGCSIVQNEVAQVEFREKMGLSNVKLIPPGTPTGIFSAETDVYNFKEKYELNKGRIIFSVGRINYEKGGDVLIKAANHLVNKLGYRDSTFLIVGPFGEFTQTKNPDQFTRGLLRTVDIAGLKGSVKFTGMLPFNELLQAYQLCEVFVSASRVENFAQAITEAAAAGKPVVSTKHPGALMQIKDGWNGFLVEVEDYQGLAEKIKYLLDNPQEAEEMGKNAKTFAKQFDWEKIANKYLEIYQL